MIKRFNIVLIICVTPLFLSGCLEGIGGCAPDFEKYETRLFMIDENGVINAIEEDWVDNSYGDLSLLSFYGLDESNDLIYFTRNYVSSPEEIIRLNYYTGDQSVFVLDEDGKSFSLSPDGSLFTYEKIRPSGAADVSIVSISDTSTNFAPRDTSVKSNRSPKWISKDEIVYKAFGESDGLGIYKVNIVDSTIEQLTDLTPRWGYSLYNEGEVVVLSVETEGNDGLSESSIYIKKKNEIDPIYVASGTYPRIIPQKEQFIFNGSDGIMISDFNGNTEALYNGSVNSNLAISPNGNRFIVTNYDGIFSIDFETKEVIQLVEMSDFISDFGQWESISSSFNNPKFSSIETKIFFSLTLRYFDDGC